MAVAGDIVEVTCNHEDLGSHIFAVKSAEDSTYDPGGFRSNDDDQGLAGNGEMIDQMNNNRPSFSAPIVWDMNNRDDLEKLRKLAASPKLGEWTITHINGTVHGLRGKPVGQIQGNGNAGTIDLKVAGSGLMEKLN